MRLTANNFFFFVNSTKNVLAIKHILYLHNIAAAFRLLFK